MSVSGLSSSALQTLLQQLNSGSSGSSSASTSNLLSSLLSNSASTSSSTSSSSASSSALSALGNSPAYVLSSSQKQAESKLVSYSNLGKLISTTEDALSTLIKQNGQGVAVDGNGKPLTTSATVDVTQLAGAQSLSTSSFGSADTSVLDTGTLTMTMPDGSSKDISISDGSLNGAATAINDSSAGIAAKVVQNSDGSYSLQITGNSTGSGNAFSLSGIADLTFDSTSASGALQETSKAQDALYTVNGGEQQSSPTNDSVSVAPGLTTSFTATGTHTVSSALAAAQAETSANALVSDFNTLMSGLPSDQQASASTSSSSTIGSALEKIAGQTFTVGKSQMTLADIGITVGSDGTLSLDQSKLSSAYASDPTAVSGVIGQVAQQISDALSQKGGVSDQVHSSLSTFVNQLAQLPSLADYLSGSASSSSGGSVADQLLAGGGLSA
jgi:flagellar hook-associated protein 2